jgi:hypothetical protein
METPLEARAVRIGLNDNPNRFAWRCRSIIHRRIRSISAKRGQPFPINHPRQPLRAATAAFARSDDGDSSIQNHSKDYSIALRLH